jgi:AGZA family xanthine/uracil permease-like MFS transporter
VTKDKFMMAERGSNLSTEILGGVTTFLTMAYIVAVNPLILSDAGIPFSAALTATCFGAAIMTLIMGLVANRPVALASGMGISTLITYSLCLNQGVDWRVAMACVFLEGLIILILVICGLREAIMNAIPVDLRRAIGIGIGLFIAFIGLKGGGIVCPSESTLVTMGSITDPVVIVALISIASAAIFTVLNVRGGLLLSIVIAVLAGIPLGVTQLPTEWNFGFDFSTFAAPFQETPDGGLAIAQVFVKPMLIMFVFSLLMSDFFDTMGTVIAVGRAGNFCDEKGEVKNLKSILLIDSLAAAVGGFFGASSITSFAESVTGARSGARTGVSNIVIAILFLICSALAPVFGIISSAATCGALVLVGFACIGDISSINWNDASCAFPAFVTILMIPLTYSITNGIGLGFLAFVLIKTFQGKAREVHPLMWVTAAAFLVAFLIA